MKKSAASAEPMADEQKKIKELEDQLAVLKEEKLHVMADFQNYKKRQEAQRSELSASANAMLLNSILELVDDYQRARQQHSKPEEKEELLKGMEVIFSKLNGFINEFGLTEVEIKPGDKFDPATMHAVASVPAETPDQDNTVVHIDAKGYKSQNNLFRAAKVIIAKIK